jgi:hypothetical protein
MANSPTTDDIKQAIITILGGLPDDVSLRFYWVNGERRVDWTEANGDTQTLRLVIGSDGRGISIPLVTQ